MARVHLLFLSFFIVVVSCGPSTAPINISYQTAKLDGKARLTGRVTDARTNEPVWAAVVSIEGTSLVSGADSNGDFYIDNIPLGKSVVRAKVISNGASVSHEIDVRPNQLVRVDFRLQTHDTK